MWQYRELLFILTAAELKNKYQNNALGFLWTILSPFLFAGILYIVFRHLFGQDINYTSNLLIGIMAWRFFTTGTTMALYSVAGKPSLVNKVFIPRKILVLSNVIAILISSILEFVILLPILYLLQGSLPPTTPLFILIHIIYAVLIYGIGLFLAAIFIYLRDANQIWDVLLMMLMFCSPIFYPLSIVPDYLMRYYMLNPVTQIMTMYRSVMVIGEIPGTGSILITIGLAAAAFIIGNLAFNKLQRRFAEEI